MSRRVGHGAFLGLGLAVVALLVVLVAPRASSEPDGLEKVAADEGFSNAESGHALDGSPTAGYTVDRSGNAWGTAAAGLLGVAVTFVVAGGVILAVRRRPPRPGAGGASQG
jgi:PDGLE domain